ALSIQSSLGTSPLDALLVGLYRTFGLSIGSWEIVVGLSMIIGNAIIERKKAEYFALITSLFTGIGIDMWMYFIGDWMIPSTWMGQLVYLTMVIVFTAMIVPTYLQSKFHTNSFDLSVLVISKMNAWNMAYLIDGAIGIRTLINALLSGVIIKLFIPYVTIIKAKTE